MTNDIRHFAVNADDLPRAKKFYEKIFGWKFEPWGPPGFFMTKAGIIGSLQQRRDLVKGVRMTGFECTIAVDDVSAVAKQIQAMGGKIVMEKATIPTVGHLIWFQDPEGNLVGAMQYDDKAE